MMRWLLLFLPLAAVAQPFSAGIKIGAPFTDSFNIIRGQSFSANNKRLVVGPFAELHLPFGFGIEVDALYRRYEYSYSAAPLSGKTSAGAWEFPVMAKYRGGLPLIKPFVAGGLSFNKLTGLKQSVSCAVGSCTGSFTESIRNNNVGLVLGAGLQVNVLVLKISPELRYTRWGFANLGAPGFLNFNKNQADVLLGISF